jgi:hypothetical protein
MSDRTRYRRTGYLQTIEHREQLNVPIIEQLKEEVRDYYNDMGEPSSIAIPISYYVNAFKALIYKGDIRSKTGFRQEFEDSNLTKYVDYDNFNQVLTDILERYLSKPIPRGDDRDFLSLEEIERLEDKDWREFTLEIGKEFTGVYDDEDAKEISEDAYDFGNDVIRWIREVRLDEPVWKYLNEITPDLRI